LNTNLHKIMQNQYFIFIWQWFDFDSTLFF
jgi:hypothetical protein